MQRPTNRLPMAACVCSMLLLSSCEVSLKDMTLGCLYLVLVGLGVIVCIFAGGFLKDDVVEYRESQKEQGIILSSSRLFSIVIVSLLLAHFGFAEFIFITNNYEAISTEISGVDHIHVVKQTALWIVFAVITAISVSEISSIQRFRAEKKMTQLVTKNRIGILIGCCITVLLFVNSSKLADLFASPLFLSMTSTAVGVGISGATGLLAFWSRKFIPAHAEFAYVLLLTFTIGLCLYARLSNIDNVIWWAFTFTIGSFLSIAISKGSEKEQPTESASDGESSNT